MHKLIRKFRALSDETRLRILNILLVRECCVCEVMEILEISQTRASRNLNILYNAGFLKSRRDGLWSFYSIDIDSMEERDFYLADTVKKGLENNRTAVQDIKRLSELETAVRCA